MTVPLTTGRAEAIIGMWWCSQQISTTPEWSFTTLAASWDSWPTANSESIVIPRRLPRPSMVWYVRCPAFLPGPP